MTTRKYYMFISLVVFLLVFAFTVLLSACESVGYEDANIDTTRKAIVIANAEVRATNLLLQDLITRQSITTSQAQQAKDALQDAKNGLQHALDAVDTSGDPVTANAWRERALRSLSVALTLLAPLAENES